MVSFLKKTLALLLTLACLLGCAFAECEAPGITAWELYMRLEPDIVVRMLNGRLGSRQLEAVLGGLLLAMNGLRVSYAADGGRADLSLTAAERPLFSVQTQSDGGALTLACDRVPGYALRFRLPRTDDPETDGLIARARAVLRPYLDDLWEFLGGILDSSRFSEDYSGLDMTVSTRQLNDLLDALAARLLADETLTERMDAALSQINAYLPAKRRLNAREVAEGMAQTLESLKVSEESEFGTLSILDHQDGTGRVELNAWGGTRFVYEDAADGQSVLLRAGWTEITAERRDGAWSLRAVRSDTDTEMLTCDLRSVPAGSLPAFDLPDRQIIDGDSLTWDSLQASFQTVVQRAFELLAAHMLQFWSQFQSVLYRLPR